MRKTKIPNGGFFCTPFRYNHMRKSFVVPDFQNMKYGNKLAVMTNLVIAMTPITATSKFVVTAIKTKLFVLVYF